MTTDSSTASRQGQGGGPRTPEGKRRVARNAITHGLTCHDVLLPDEPLDAFDQFRNAMIADAQPVGAEEQCAVERMVAAEWKLRRLWRAETGVYAIQRYRLDRPAATVGNCVAKDLRSEAAFAQLNRQEAHLERMILRASRRLQELQALRRKGLRPVVEEEAGHPAPATAAQQAPAPVAATTGSAADPAPTPAAAPEPPVPASVPFAAPRPEASSDSSSKASGENAEQTSGAVVPPRQAAA